MRFRRYLFRPYIRILFGPPPFAAWLVDGLLGFKVLVLPLEYRKFLVRASLLAV